MLLLSAASCFSLRDARRRRRYDIDGGVRSVIPNTCSPDAPAEHRRVFAAWGGERSGSSHRGDEFRSHAWSGEGAHSDARSGEYARVSAERRGRGGGGYARSSNRPAAALRCCSPCAKTAGRRGVPAGTPREPRRCRAPAVSRSRRSAADVAAVAGGRGRSWSLCADCPDGCRSQVSESNEQAPQGSYDLEPLPDRRPGSSLVRSWRRVANMSSASALSCGQG